MQALERLLRAGPRVGMGECRVVYRETPDGPRYAVAWRLGDRTIIGAGTTVESAVWDAIKQGW